MTPEDIEKAELAADSLYDRKRGLVAIVILADLDTQEARVMARTPDRLTLNLILVKIINETLTGGRTQTIQSDDPPPKEGPTE